MELKDFLYINPYPAKLIYLNFNPPEVVSLPLPTTLCGWKLIICLIWAQIFANLDA